MTDPECGLFDRENVAMLLDEEATRERIWRALAGLRRKSSMNDTVWLFYAGHGAPEGVDSYWVPHDGDVDDLFATGLSRKEINRVLDELAAERIVVFLDCCHAAAMAVQKNRTRVALTAEVAIGAYKGKGRLIFAASDGREKSVEVTEVAAARSRTLLSEESGAKPTVTVPAS
ncbi:MAG: caspase family protein [candidate division KSB1 bacterium]|nr:caspase family protein [candidate division KSB1 bacterium]